MLHLVGLLKDANSPDDIEEGVEDEIEFDDDVLEQAKELVKRAKDGNCDAVIRYFWCLF